MTVITERSPYAIAFTRCLRRAAVPALLATVVAMAGATWMAPELGATATAPAAMSSWLALPMLVVAAVVAGTAIVLWPTFTARNPGSDWIARIQRGPLTGCGAVLAGALAAQLALTLPLTTWMARGLGAPSAALAHHELAPPESPILAPGQPGLVFDLPEALVISRIELRPRASLPSGPLQASRVRVRADGDILGADRVLFDQTGQVARLAFDPRPTARIEIELIAGNVPLFFTAGAVIAVEATPRSGTANGCLAAAIWLLPTFVALAFACLCGAVAATPTVLTVAFALLLMMTVVGIGPGSPAILALLRGHWLPSAGIFAAGAPSLTAGSAAMIGAMLLRRRTRT